MKKATDKLFELIKTLSPQEKIYFKTYSSYISENNNYVKLFDILNKQKSYDEDALRKRIGNKTALRNLKHTKSRLTEAVLKSLTYYHADFSIESQIQSLLQQAEILSHKRLFLFALKVLKKAEKLGIEHDKHEYLLIIFSVKTWIALKSNDSSVLKAYSDFNTLKENKYLEKVGMTVHFRSLVMRMCAIYYVRPNIRDKQVLDEIKSIFSSPLLSLPKAGLSYSSLRDYNYLELTRAETLNKWDRKSYRTQVEWIEYIEKDTANLLYREEDYLTELRRLISIQIKTGQISKIESTFNKAITFYISLPTKYKGRDVKVRLISLTVNYMAAHIAQGKLQLVIDSWNNVRRLIPEHIINFDARLVIYGNLFYVYFALEKYHEALNYLNKILDFKFSSRLDIQAHARTCLLLVHFELGNFDLLQYFAKSSYRWLVKNNYADDFAKVFCKFFEKRIYRANNEKERIELFKELKNELIPLLKEALPDSLAKNFDYISWLDSKIKRRPFVEMVKEKSSNKSE